MKKIMMGMIVLALVLTLGFTAEAQDDSDMRAYLLGSYHDAIGVRVGGELLGITPKISGLAETAFYSGDAWNVFRIRGSAAYDISGIVEGMEEQEITAKFSLGLGIDFTSFDDIETLVGTVEVESETDWDIYTGLIVEYQLTDDLIVRADSLTGLKNISSVEIGLGVLYEF